MNSVDNCRPPQDEVRNSTWPQRKLWSAYPSSVSLRSFSCSATGEFIVHQTNFKKTYDIHRWNGTVTIVAQPHDGLIVYKFIDGNLRGIIETEEQKNPLGPLQGLNPAGAILK